MGCEDNETNVNVNIPVVMLPLDAGVILEKYLQNNSTGMPFFCMYSSKLGLTTAFAPPYLEVFIVGILSNNT